MSTLKIEHITNISRSGEDLSIDTNGNITSIGIIKADGGNLILGDEALSVDSQYVGLKTSYMTGTADYMILSGTTANSIGDTFVSAKSGSNVFIRGGGNDPTHQIEIQSGQAKAHGILSVVSTALVGNADFGSYNSTHGNLMVSNGANPTSILLYNDAGAYNSSLIQYDTNVLKLGLNNSNSANTLLTTSAINVNATGVGIGSAPESTVKLEVNAGADGAVAISGRSDGGNGNNRRFNLIPYADGGGANYGGGLKIQTRDSVNVFHDRITVQSNGNVGIGTASPATRLQVAGTQNTPSSTSKGMLLVRADGSSHGLQMGVMGTSPWGSRIHVPDTSRLIVGNTLGDAVNVNANYKNSLQQYTRMATSTSVNHPGSASSTKHYLYDRATVGDKVNIPLTVFFPNGISNLAIRLYYNDYSLWISGEAITGSTYNNAQATGFRRYSFSHNYNGTTNYENVLTNTENVGLNSSHFELNHHGYDANESGGAHYWEFRHIQSTGNALHVQFQMHGSGVSYATGTWYFKCTTY